MKTKARGGFEVSAKKVVTEEMKTDTMDISKNKRNSDVQTVGKIDKTRYSVIEKNIRTDEVIITNERIDHIRKRRGDAFYEKYNGMFAEILRNPDYIFKETRAYTALVCKKVVQDKKYINLVLRIAIETDNPKYKNSIITAIGESEKRFAQHLRNNAPLYKKE